MKEYFATIGLEIHLTLNTNTKMFSPAKNSYNDGVNNHINEIDLGLIGSMPSVNLEAVKKGIKLGLLLNCDIASTLSFDRKNYYYEDLPKNFQITQYFNPLAKNGYVCLSNKKIKIIEAHLEEDTAKIKHFNDEILFDYNRSGNPLMEIVTSPDFKDENEVKEFLLTLIKICKENEISEASLSQGKLRVDVNISVSDDKNKLGKKVELKGLNNLKNITKAIKYEVNRQMECLNNNEKIIEHTRVYDEKSKTTIFKRNKDSVIDYKFMTEPNILEIDISSLLNKKDK